MRRLFLAVLLVAVTSQTAGAASDAAAKRKPKPVANPDTALVHLGPADAGTNAFVAYPTGTAPAAAVIVVHEWWGLNSQIRELARRLARQGYVAIVPDLYHGKVASDPTSAHELMRGLDEDQAVTDLAAAAAWLREQPRTAKRNYGVMGFCMGGHLAEMLAFQDLALSAVAVFYGVPETRPDRIAALKAPLIGHYGAEDQGIDTSRVAAFRQSLVNAGKKSEVYVYLGAGHAFMNQEQPSYRPDAAQLAWARTLAFLQKYLKGLS
jgi:carboxymethylenebutenolidase